MKNGENFYSYLFIYKLYFIFTRELVYIEFFVFLWFKVEFYLK